METQETTLQETTQEVYLEVNGKKVTLQELEEYKKNPNCKLTEVAPGKFKLLEKMYG